ncbi:MAG: hypothetical protein A3H57_04415 [Candidatus Taylorbacteria bacterium RIFCSPLOWO2_02_FULL_43_11]|uniref:Uncharacterized protein n=1 Tax=Candidatus Taylorbacteria bacterium RIFCSPHIGHO2_02_FULL_43_32b TaxID=1802306 RepID=A0A1G2MGZ2_9BACT|nr:MAG: hypothetical protein A2743_02150 [Candidatus Taylorbacteria bacterium RIFCSPHIGHO2_01_FULL_43_47]OHA22439.1 MAG: hypothetical protein A3C72_03365 [Candidatus Taylorbacteria bacterium RIFCSPHIGHO2_02_FULL_43_32b]OHA31627.1 MAG: hypothetical protein A3B08_04070 [Candidatus Taylorbacteria bacterium RIFCSPLOWO2_01_FULL_43_44]OHA36208.1 MAG: hypothetical protein A3H57_04415 [Candidatus Taylorbacteria bacterium RIFCSPLOWO2_02_FULL_43_11]
MSRKLLYLFTLLIIGIGVYAIYNNELSSGDEVLSINRYVGEDYGIVFDYPDRFVLEEKEIGNGERRHRLISLIESKSDDERKSDEDKEEITFDIYQNDLDKLSIDEWVLGNGNSNFKLSDGAYSTTSIGEKDAIAYEWSGLYEAKTTVFESGGHIIAVSVKYKTSGNSLTKNYDDLVKTIRFVGAAPQI